MMNVGAPGCSARTCEAEIDCSIYRSRPKYSSKCSICGSSRPEWPIRNVGTSGLVYYLGLVYNDLRVGARVFGAGWSVDQRVRFRISYEGLILDSGLVRARLRARVSIKLNRIVYYSKKV